MWQALISFTLAMICLGCVNVQTSSAQPAGNAPAVVIEGVPRVDPDYEKDVLHFWATHPFNPQAPVHVKDITSPQPIVQLTDGQSIQQAIDNLPTTGGTIHLAPGRYGPFKIVARNNVHIISDGGAFITGHSRIAVSPLALDYGAFDRAISGKGQPVDKAAFHDFANPTKNFYFKNITFDGEGKERTSIRLQRVWDVVFDNCVFQGFVNPGRGHPACAEGHMGLNNIWFRNCHFKGDSVAATYLDGAHGSGMIDCIVDGDRFNSFGFLFLTNDDYTEDVNGNGKIDRDEERNAKYVVVVGNTFSGRLLSAVQIAGEEVLVMNNRATGVLDQLLWLDFRYSDQHLGWAYKFGRSQTLNNEVNRCLNALVAYKNIEAEKLPAKRAMPILGQYVIRGNRIGQAPKIVSHESGEIHGPFVVEDNTIERP